MDGTLRERRQRWRYLILSIVLMALAAWSANLATSAFDVLAIALGLLATGLVLLAFRRPSRRDR